MSDADGRDFYFTLGGYRWGNPNQGAAPPGVGDATVPGAWGTAYPTGTLAQDYRGSSGWGSVYTATNRGSHRLYNTLFTTEDIYATTDADRQAWRAHESLAAGADPSQELFGSYENGNVDYGLGNRLKSFWYYHHNYNYGTTQACYQLEHLRKSRGDIDDIGGTVENQNDRRERPYPINSGPTGTANLGFAMGAGSAGHDADAMVAE